MSTMTATASLWHDCSCGSSFGLDGTTTPADLDWWLEELAAHQVCDTPKNLDGTKVVGTRVRAGAMSPPPPGVTAASPLVPLVSPGDRQPA